MNPLNWFRDAIAAYRAWRENRWNAWLDRQIERAKDPQVAAARRRKKEQENGRLELTEDGFRLIHRGAVIFTVRWTDVRKIWAYKRDLFTVDLICLGFEFEDEQWVEVPEDMADFELVDEKMRALYPTIPEQWSFDVMLPPSETNQRVLWSAQRESESPA